jgi:MFS-type transporter involved in bile tolerance (Atg22 family)
VATVAATSTAKALPRTVVILGIVSLLTDASSEMILPLLPMLMLGTLGGSTVMLGLVDGVADAVAAVLKLVAGRLSDGRPKRPFVLVGYGISSVVRPLIGLAMSPWHVVVFRAGDRVGKGIRSAPRDALLSLSVDDNNATRAFGFHRAMDHTGAVIGPLLATAVLAVGLDVRTAIQLAWIPGIAAVAVLLLFLREAPAVVAPAATTTTTTTTTTPAPHPLSPALRRRLVVIGLFSLGAVADTFLLVRANELGLSTPMLPVVWVVLHLAKVLAASRGNRLPLQGEGAVALAWVLVAVGFALAAVSSVVVFWCAVVVIGLGHGGREPFEKAIVRQLSTPETFGRSFGAYHLTSGLLALPSGLLVGLLWSKDGPGGPTALLAAAVVVVVAASVLLAMRRPQTGR